jgi:MinD-like ATPase involved in chromosome partitioning or flagellar assembly
MTGRVIAFYGFKGGAGRSFLLASTAALLSALGRRVLVIDADMEAPGLGDFFDTNINSTDLRSGLLFSESRLRRGFLDLMYEVANSDFVMNHGSELKGTITKLLDPKTVSESAKGHPYLTEVGPFRSVGDGRLYLMGAGSHRVTREDGSFSYIARLLDFDWTARMQGREKFAFDSLGEVLAGGELFDDILIDGRTGYNAASIVAIRNLATDVVMVGTSSMQSIDGMARMRPLFAATDGDREGLRTHMVMSKMSGTVPEEAHRERRAQAARVKERLNTEYHPGQPFYDLPYIEDFVTGDALLFRRLGIRDIVPTEDNAAQLDNPELSRNEKTNIAVGIYKHRFLSFVRDIVGPEGLGKDGPSIDAHALEIAFDSWGAEQRERSGVRTGFDATLALPDRDEVQRASETAMSQMFESIEDYLNPDRKTQDDPHQSTAYANRPRAKSPLLDALELQFAALRLEERALVQVQTVALLTQNQGEYKPWVVDEVYNVLRLAVSPNVVRGAQINALGLLNRQPAPSSADPEPYKSKGSIDRKLNKVRLTKLCEYLSNILEIGSAEDKTHVAEEIRSEIAEDLGRTQDLDFYAALRFLDLYTLALSQAEDARDAIRLEANRVAVELLQEGNPFLPQDLSTLSAYNILDLMKRLGNIKGASTAPSASAMARLALMRIYDLCGPFKTGSVAEKSNAIQDILAWCNLWAANAICDIGFAAPIPANYPSSEDLATAIALIEDVVTTHDADEENVVLWLTACEALVGIAAVLDDAPRAHTTLERVTNFVEGRITRSSFNLGRHLQAFKALASIIRRADLTWRLERLDDVLRTRNNDVGSSGVFNFDAYIGLARAGQDLGLPLHENHNAFPDMPDQLVTSDLEKVEKDFGWWRDASALNFGEFLRFVKAAEAEKGTQQPTASQLSFLTVAEVHVGAIEKAIGSFEKWQILALSGRNRHIEGIATYTSLSTMLLRSFLDDGDLATFDRLRRETDHAFPQIDEYAGKIHFILRRLVILRHAAVTNALRDDDVARQAQAILAQGLEIVRRLTHPTDAALAPLLGGLWDNLGAFGGYECPSLARTSIATMMLDALELIPEPHTDHLSTLEKLIWGNDARHRGESATPTTEKFLGPLENRLHLERARLEWLRAQLKLPAALEVAVDVMLADLALNGAGRASHYPRGLRELSGSEP